MTVRAMRVDDVAANVGLGLSAAPVRLHLRVDAITCASCERHIERAPRRAQRIPVANFRRGEVHVSAPATAASEVFTAAVVQTRYRPGKMESVTPERSWPLRHSVATCPKLSCCAA